MFLAPAGAMRRRHTSHRLSLAPPEEPFGSSDGRRACKPNTESPLPAALRLIVWPIRTGLTPD
eukprot:4017814-Prymnesium_polylepis.1